MAQTPMSVVYMNPHVKDIGFGLCHLLPLYIPGPRSPDCSTRKATWQREHPHKRKPATLTERFDHGPIMAADTVTRYFLSDILKTLMFIPLLPTGATPLHT